MLEAYRHADHVAALDVLFAAYGQRPTWHDRHEAMQQRCRALLEFCRRWNDEGVRLWQRRLHTTATWNE